MKQHKNINQNRPDLKHIEMTDDIAITKRTKLFIVYCFMSLCWGITEIISASLFIQLQIQTSVSEQQMAFCFVTWNIGRAISAICSGKLIDYFKESHRYMITSLTIFVIAMFYLPYTNNILVMHFINFIIGYTWSVFAVCQPVYIFRLYPEYKKSAHRIYIILCLVGTVKTIFPLLIQLSIEYTNKYIYPLYISNVITIILIIVLLFFKTPQHDKLRTIKAELQNKNDKNNNINILSEHISKMLNKDKLNKILV
eukprot:425191_1